MTIQLDESIRAIVFCQFAEKSDFMCALSEVPDSGGKVTMMGRIRHYNGDQSKDPFEDGDRKDWMKSRKPDSFEEELKKILETISTLQVLATVAGRESSNKRVYVLKRMEGQTLEQFMELFGKMPFAHMKKMSLQ